jgi:hypothetical protein
MAHIKILKIKDSIFLPFFSLVGVRADGLEAGQSPFFLLLH